MTKVIDLHGFDIDRKIMMAAKYAHVSNISGKRWQQARIQFQQEKKTGLARYVKVVNVGKN